MCIRDSIQTIRFLFERLREHNLELSPSKARLGATDANFLGHSISPAGLRPNAEKVSALINMPMPMDVKQVRALMGGINYYRKILPTCPRGFARLTRFFGKELNLRSRRLWKKLVRDTLAELATPPILVFPNCCLLYTSPSPRDLSTSRMPSSA